MDVPLALNYRIVKYSSMNCKKKSLSATAIKWLLSRYITVKDRSIYNYSMVKEISANLRVIIIIVQNRPNCFASLAIRSILDNSLPHLHWESNTLKKLNVISYRLMSLKAIKSRKLCS